MARRFVIDLLKKMHVAIKHISMIQNEITTGLFTNNQKSALSE